MSALHILLVDDHASTRSAHKRVLKELGATEVSVARDGKEALERARTHRPDIVISDFNVPGMDGMTFISQLAQERLADSVIIASGLAPGVLKAVEAMAGASGVRVLGAIEKPLRKDALASMLHLHANPSTGASAATVKVFDASAVERAVEAGQFKAWYSPVIDVTFMRTVSANVIPQWESPDHGTISGDEEFAPLLDLPAAPSVMRAMVSAALNAGGLWTQMGWNGVIAMPTGLATIRDAAFWDWLSATVRKHGANGTVAIAVDGGQFAADPARGAFAVARAIMDGYYLVVRVKDVRQFDALRALAGCSVVTCPVEWVEGDAAAMQKVYDFAARMGADIGVSGVDDAALLGKLAAVGVRRASGLAIGRPASAVETYDTHMAFR